MNTTPPTDPLDQGDEVSAGARLHALEKRVRLLIYALFACIILIAGLGTMTGVLLAHHATLIAERAVEDSAQLQLLQELQTDFEALDIAVPENNLDAYAELQRQMKELQGIYNPMAEFDLTDPQGSLDRLLGEDRTRTRHDESPDE